jgi:hypothetical protein
VSFGRETRLGNRDEGRNRTVKSKLLGMLTGLSVGMLTGGALSADNSSQPLTYPNIVDTSHATERVASIFRSFFTAKSEHNATELMEHFFALLRLLHRRDIGRPVA